MRNQGYLEPESQLEQHLNNHLHFHQCHRLSPGTSGWWTKEGSYRRRNWKGPLRLRRSLPHQWSVPPCNRILPHCQRKESRTAQLLRSSYRLLSRKQEQKEEKNQVLLGRYRLRRFLSPARPLCFRISP